MKFLSDLFGRKRAGQPPAEPTVENFANVTGRMDVSDPPQSTDALLDKVNTTVGDKSPKNNIWDLDDDLPPVETLQEMVPSAPKKSPARARRTKTRLIGFENTDGVVDLFSDAPTAPPASRTKFPVGWVVVVEGPGRGEAFTLVAGMSQIGRGEDQAVQLDFGDSSVSRTNHAAIVYDAENHTFLLGHGGKSNIVRLNDKPVISNETMKDGDLIKIGETTLRFKPLCSEEFNWTGKNDDGDEESEDVAIA